MPADAENEWKGEKMQEKKKIVVLDGYVLNPGDLSWEPLARLGELTVYERTAPEQTAERIGEAQIVLTNKTVLDGKIMEACPKLRYIGVLATGYNVVDVRAAADRGIAVTNIPSYGTASVAQYTIALLLELCHHIGEHSECVKRGEWSRNRDWCFWKHPLMELDGKTMGIVGYGRIGRQTGKIAEALGMRVLAWSGDRKEKACRSGREKDGGAEYVSFEELLAQSDVISLHCPLFPETEGLINRETIARMKDGVLLLNDSRGPLIVERDLREALDSGKVGGAALDVVSAEPIRADSPLLGAKNIIITPHIAWAPREARERLLCQAARNLEGYLAGVPVNIVNRK